MYPISGHVHMYRILCKVVIVVNVGSPNRKSKNRSDLHINTAPQCTLSMPGIFYDYGYMIIQFPLEHFLVSQRRS